METMDFIVLVAGFATWLYFIVKEQKGIEK